MSVSQDVRWLLIKFSKPLSNNDNTTFFIADLQSTTFELV